MDELIVSLGWLFGSGRPATDGDGIAVRLRQSDEFKIYLSLRHNGFVSEDGLLCAFRGAEERRRKCLVLG